MRKIISGSSSSILKYSAWETLDGCELNTLELPGDWETVDHKRYGVRIVLRTLRLVAENSERGRDTLERICSARVRVFIGMELDSKLGVTRQKGVLCDRPF